MAVVTGLLLLAFVRWVRTREILDGLQIAVQEPARVADQPAVERNSEDSVVEVGWIQPYLSSTRLVAVVRPNTSRFGKEAQVRMVPMLTAEQTTSAVDYHIAAHTGGRCRLPH